ncbi:MAG: DUF1588 domain-containing protein [Myxococcota bacterium]
MIALFALIGCGGGGGNDAPTCGEEEPAERLLRRLTHDEYRRTVEDLTGVTVDASLASDPTVENFRNDAHALVVNGLLADQYRTAAESVGQAYNVEGNLPCNPTEDGDVACATSFVETFGLRAFRRPLNDDDIEAYVGLWSEVASEDGFSEGVRWVVTAMLQSPHFLYRSELGTRERKKDPFVLSDWEMATALSYLLWGTMPDATLFEAAAVGQLRTDEQVEAQIDRMIGDPRAVETVADFVDAWLDLGQLQTVAREGLTDDARQTMADETRAQVAQWVEEGGTLASLLAAEDGLLTQASVLTTHARPDGSSPVHRGVLIRERLLCEELPPPPPNIDTSPPPVDPTKSTRDRYREHSDNPDCSGCHVLIDPLGFAFEHYDQLGQWRDDDAGHPIDDSGALDGVPFEGPEGLAMALLDDPRFRECFVYSWRRHARGTHACGDDRGTDVLLIQPLLEVLTTYGFRHRDGARSEKDTLAVGDGGPVSAPNVPGAVGAVEFRIEVNNDWGGGFCANGSVHNDGQEPVTWSGRYAIDGSISSIWDAVVEEDGANWVFSGRDNNATLEPGERTQFGFCAQR